MNRAMTIFSNLQLKWKFTVISMAITFIVMIVLGALFITADYINSREEFIKSALIDTDITGQNCSAALLFGDSGTAKDILNAKKFQANVLRTLLLDAKGHDFAEYLNAGEKPSAIRPVSIPEGWGFEGDVLIIKKPVMVDQKRVGSIYIERSLRDLYHHELIMTTLMFAIILLSFPLALWLSLGLQNFITGPIHNLVSAANRVSVTRDYSIRVPVGGKDELGDLVRVFNDMLVQIEERDLQLKSHTKELEIRVRERTAQLQESESRFRQFSEAAFEGILVHDWGIVLDANEMFMQISGYGHSELIGKNALEILATPDQRLILEEKIRTGAEGAYEVMGVRKDGSPIYLEIRGRKIVYQGRKARIAAVRDISERKKAEIVLQAAKEEAENATRIKDKFVAAASHDLRSPIASLQVLVRYMQGRPEIQANPETKSVFATALKSTQGILKLIDGLLDLNRIQMGKVTCRLQECEATGIVLAAIQPLQALADAKNIAIHHSLPPGMVIKVDESLMVQVVQNLISNAIKYCGNGGKILIDGRMAARGFVLEVKDTGTGISPELLKRLFTENFLNSTPGTAGEKGSGLGLQLCQEIIKMHGGQITVESTVGEGTTFAICIPLPPPLSG